MDGQGPDRGMRTPVGDADVPRMAELFGEPSRARILMALLDGRALPASRLADEAGVSPPAASAQLARLRSAGLIRVEQSGRHRYYSLAGAEVAAVLEAMAAIAPPKPVRSLREGTRAHALRTARTCYDHLAGQLGVAVTRCLLNHDALASVDGVPGLHRRPGDELSSPGRNNPYTLGPEAVPVLARLGVDLAAVRSRVTTTGRPLLRFCLDWTEQQHHLAGGLGAALLEALIANGWLIRPLHGREVHLTERGSAGLARCLGVPPQQVFKAEPLARHSATSGRS